MKNNNIPKRYKNSSLGNIPKDWKVKKLREIANIKKGIQVNKINLTPYNIYPVINGGREPSGFHDKYNTKANTITISEGGNSCGYVNLITTKFWSGGHCYTVFENDTIDKFFLFQKLKQLEPKIMTLRVGSALPNIQISPLLKFKIAIPSFPEQQKIAEILSVWDNAIEKQTKLIEKLETRKRALMQQLLTGKKRLKGFDGEWKTVKLGDVCERITRKNTNGCKNIVTISSQRGFISQTDFFNKRIASDITDNYFLVHRDEFCYNKSYCNGYPMGAIKRLTTFEQAVVTMLYICFSIKNTLNLDFIENYFESGLLNNGLVKIANEGGRAHGLLNVTPSDFFNLKIYIPNKNEQTAIAEILSSADREINLAKKKLSNLKEQKKGLMQVLLTGKKRVKIN